MFFGMQDKQEKTLSKGSSAYLLASVGVGASRQCCDATQAGRMSHLKDLKSWTRQTWFRRGVIEEIGRYVEGRDEAGVISNAEVGAIWGSPKKGPALQEIGPETLRKGERSLAGRSSCIMMRPVPRST